MKTGKNNFLLLIAGLLFITSVSADSIIHDHISEEEILIECQYNENKTVDINKAVDNNFYLFFFRSCKPY